MFKSIAKKLRAALTIAGLSISSSSAQEEKNPKYEIGLSMYSLHPLFRSGELKALDYPDFAKKNFGITKIDVWDGGYPKGWKDDPKFLPELKRRADAAGCDIFLVMTGTVMATSNDEAELKQAGLKYKSYVDQAVALDAKLLRVFLRINKKDSEQDSIRKASIALGALSDYAATKDVTVVIEPSPNTPLGSYLAKLVKTMNHKHCKLMPDFGKMRGTDFYQGTKDMMPHSVSDSAKGHDFNEDGTQKDFDYPRLMKIVREAGFKGIVSIEYEGKNFDPVKGVKAMKKILEECNK